MAKKSKDLKVPELDPCFFVPEDVIDTLDRLERLSERHPVNVLVSGRQGCGKSSLVRQFAAYYKRPLTVFQIGLLSESGQLFGEQRLRGGETFYQEFLFPKAIATPKCVIHLEEINRPQNARAFNELFSLLSEDRCIWIDELGMVEVAPGTVFFATLNEGEEFVGTETLDAALMDRFYAVSMEYLPLEIERKVLVMKAGVTEEQAAGILDIIHKLRHNTQLPLPISTRHSLMIAELVAMGSPMREAVTYSLQVSKDVLESLLLSIHAETGDKSVQETVYKLFLPER